MAALAAFVGATGFTLLRLPDGLAFDTLWAEDGSTFLQEAVDRGPFRSLLVTYEGYLQLVPRVVLGIVSLFPLPWWPALCSLAAAAGVGAVVLFVYRAAAAHLPSRSVRTGLSALLVLLPLAGYEAVASLANLHWYLHVAAFWALLWRPDSRRHLLSSGLVCFAAAATDGLAVVLLPLALLRVVVLRDRWQWAPSLGLLLGLVLQFAMVAQAPGLTPAPSPSPEELVRTYLVRVLLAVFGGDELTESGFTRFGWTAPLVAVAVVAVLAAVGRNRLGLRLHLVVACLMVHGAFFLVPVVLRWSPLLVPSPGSALDHASRFMLVPFVLLWTVGAVLVEGGPRRGAGFVMPRAAAALVLLVTGFTDFVANGPRVGGPRWSSQLNAAATSCPTAGRIDLRITPDNGQWKVSVPCDRVPGAGVAVGSVGAGDRR